MAEPTMFMIKPKGRTAHAFRTLDGRIPMRALCGYKAWPQEVIPAGNCEQSSDRPYDYKPPVYCPKCFDRLVDHAQT